ncbi:MAG: outer membrane protein assembly factor BamE [Hyphomicrobiaceae bacterium]|nr:outer membrane protein assembly factor BamE [Hyphomicrobiaceae bacterium]
MQARFKHPRLLAPAALALVAALGLAGCETETLQHGYVIPENALEQIPQGSSREQVLVVLGTPQTTATIDNEVFYYVSQRSERRMAFMVPEVTEQRVLAVYFDAEQRVERVAEYGLQDGQVFDFVSRTTPTGGQDLSFVGQLLRGVGRTSF